ncbi:hypothetical protein BJ085DRAFT_30123 [Dimargaris cristalligena]|uniref:Mediator of RNA polymerase II transcription subunit 1 n=1 Tax=Dimargaris cristalligena TaxID=215637 RepID=A0A4P9ZY33_9FUNG|nr:hypothetical protein BJ085DRAFT_30123 [Dimargaris cristalligena]|eukprot:RKP37832.1 hypothetical protein BJ085DRAFT_30123 [Dimargaris cristalligena]
MASDPPPQKVQESLDQLERSLRQLSGAWQFSSPALALTSQGQMHPLGPINIDAVQGEFTKSVQQLRQAIQSFKDRTLTSEAFNMTTSNTILRKLYNSLKEESRILASARNTTTALRDAIDLLNSQAGRPLTEARPIVQAIVDVGESQKMTHYIDSHVRNNGTAVTTVTLCGAVVVVDVDVAEGGRVLAAKVTYATGTPTDSRIDQTLTGHLVRRDKAAFTQSIATLALLDRLTTQYEHTDFFRIVTVIRKDLQRIFEAESAALGGDLREVMAKGHGLPFPDCYRPGPTLLYWAPESTSADLSSSTSVSNINPDHFYKLWISVEESTVPICFLPASVDGFVMYTQLDAPTGGDTMHSMDIDGSAATPQVPPPLDHPNAAIPSFGVAYFQATPENGVAAQARFVAHLAPPIPVAEAYAKSLAFLCDTNLHDFNLVPPTQEGLVSHEALLLENASPVGVVLRQQVLYNTLFRSCFNMVADRTSRQPEKSADAHLVDWQALLQNADNDIPVEITAECPGKLSLSTIMPMQYGSNPTPLYYSIALEIIIEVNPYPRVWVQPGAITAMQSEANDPGRGALLRVCQSDKLSRVLQVSENIPLMMYWIQQQALKQLSQVN